jgi:hypothetical protein
MKSLELTESRAKELVYNAFIRERVMPLRSLPDVHRLYFDDQEQRDKFEARSLCSLSNAFIEVVKSLRVMPQQHAGVAIGRYFGRTLRMELNGAGRFAMTDSDPEDIVHQN